VIGERPVKARKRIEIPIDLSGAETLLAKTEQRPAMFIRDARCLINQLCRLVGK